MGHEVRGQLGSRTQQHLRALAQLIGQCLEALSNLACTHACGMDKGSWLRLRGREERGLGEAHSRWLSQ